MVIGVKLETHLELKASLGYVVRSCLRPETRVLRCGPAGTSNTLDSFLVLFPKE